MEGVLIETALGLFAVAVLIAANGLFVAAEFALVAVDRARVEQRATDGSRPARHVLVLLERLSYHLSGAQLGITVTSLVLGFVAQPTIGALIDPAIEPVVGARASTGVSIVAALVLATIVQMVLGELIPKTLAIARPVGTALAVGPPFRAFNSVAAPITGIVNAAADRLTRMLGFEPADELHDVRSLDELAYLIRHSGQEGTLAPAEVTLLTRAIRFGDKTAADALVPRVGVTGIAADATVSDLLTCSEETGHSRFPVIRADLDDADLDDLVGVVHVKSVLDVAPERRGSARVAEIMGPVFAVPEGRDLASIFLEMRERRSQLAVVVDEHGGTAGILTLEDLVEEIVGAIDDEYDDAGELTVLEDEGVWVLSGSLHPDEVEEACGFVMPDGPYETLAGYVLHRLQRIPRQGEVFRHEGWLVEVAELDRRRVATARLRAPHHVIQARLRAGVTGTLGGRP